MKSIFLLLFFASFANSADWKSSYIGSGDSRYVNLTEASSVTLQNASFSVGGSTFVVSGGLVGILNSAPGDVLSVGSSASPASPRIRVQGSSSAGMDLYVGAVQTGQFYASGNDATFKNVVNNTGADLIFTTNDTAERMRILGSGNVGIGTTAPTAKLSINTPSTFNIQTDYAILISSNGTSTYGIHPNGHHSVYGSTTTIATCTNGAMVSNSRDTAGAVSFSGANSTCGITFGSNWDALPICVLTGAVATAAEGAIISQISTSSMTFIPNTGAWDTGDKINYICIGIH